MSIFPPPALGLLMDTRSASAQLIDLTSLIAYWKLDEASGNALDAHGSNNLTDTNTVTSAAGVIGTARSFAAASTEYFTAGADSAALSTGDIDCCFSAWVRITDLTAERTILSKWSGTAGQEEFILRYLNTTNRFQFLWYVAGSAKTVVASNFGDVSANTWYHIYAYHDSIANLAGISINNGSDNTTAADGGTDGNTAFEIGRRGSAANLWNGQIDEVAFFKRLLTAAERTSIYNAGAGLAYPFTG